jgi:predicted RNA-binding Zn-ribbon protein involved in translation (DUF1610 family)
MTAAISQPTPAEDKLSAKVILVSPSTFAAIQNRPITRRIVIRPKNVRPVTAKVVVASPLSTTPTVDVAAVPTTTPSAVAAAATAAPTSSVVLDATVNAVDRSVDVATAAANAPPLFVSGASVSIAKRQVVSIAKRQVVSTCQVSKSQSQCKTAEKGTTLISDEDVARARREEEEENQRVFPCTVTKIEMWDDRFVFRCPQCGGLTEVGRSEIGGGGHRSDINCGIFRHGSLKTDPCQRLPPHATKAQCEALLDPRSGCGKPFRFDGRSATTCDYI